MPNVLTKSYFEIENGNSAKHQTNYIWDEKRGCKKIDKKIIIKKEKAASVDLIQFLPLIVYFNSVFVLSLLVFGTTFHWYSVGKSKSLLLSLCFVIMIKNLRLGTRFLF